jgi:AraC-like DNA-binding protein
MGEAGATSMTHFVSYFKERYGVSPSAYRKSSAIFDKH